MKAILATCVPHEKLIVRGPRSRGERPRLALTFDDGPHPEHTPRLLDLLEKLGLHATFFVIGQNAEKHPELVRRMAAAGHEVANHTYTHSEPRLTPVRMLLTEIQRTDDLLSHLTGNVTSSFRPPKGELNWAKLRGIWRNHKTVALWNVDPKDFRMKHADEMTRWCQDYKPQDGDIILMHDIHPYALSAVAKMSSSGIFEQFETTTIEQWVQRIDRPIPQTAGT